MTVRNLFVTRFYENDLGDSELITDLEKSVRTIARDDKAGQAWCRDNGYVGYTSYASLNDLVTRDPAFDDLRRQLDIHVRAFAKAAYLDLGGKKPKLDSLWVNILKPGGGHSGHIHPHSIVSGTLYIRVPPGAGLLKLEDPRLPAMMAAPQRTSDAPEEDQTFHYAAPSKGKLFLWESWLRHEVPPGNAKSDRISISFNYR
jgi:uncharacterized protein (TIGR02466 family)